MDQRFDELTRELGHLRHARRHVARSLEASGVVLNRTLAVDQRGTSSRRMLLLPMAALLMVVPQHQWVPAQLPRTHVPAEITAPSQPILTSAPAASAAAVPDAHALTIHVQAIRPCRVRLVVDGTVLDWRSLRAGDEFFSRPEHTLMIQSDDGAALSATVNGKPISLGESRSAISIEFTTTPSK